MAEEYIHEYIFSGSLPENASTYVKREADDELYHALKQGKFCYVLNSRQSGKSSLRVRTMSRLTNAGVECASIDLSSVSIQSATQENWYADLIVKLIDSFVLDLDFKQWWEKNQLNSPLMRFSNFLEKHLLVEIEENIVIFIDEIDSVLSLNFPTDDFFAFIRACYNQRVDNPAYNNLTFCLLGVASPSNLIEDKNRTPFNIGKAISLKGFQLHETEPLIKGLQGKFSETQAVMQEILDWTGGQPFLTQKLCQFMLEESTAARKSKVISAACPQDIIQKSKKDDSPSVEEVVKARIIESWESQDEPEHLRTIRSRMFRNEERAGYLLELYQQIRRSEVESEIIADNTIEQSELLLSGLVARREGKLRVYNRIYQEVFNQNWVENELKSLRPYSESFKFWVASGGKDESRLLRGQALTDAEEWAKDKNLSYQDKQFLAASREKEIQEKIAAEEKEARLERERKDREAAEKRNQVLSDANKKAKKRIRNGTVVLILALFGAVSLGVVAATKGYEALEAQDKALEAQKTLDEINNVLASPRQLKDLAKKFSPNSKQKEKILKLADIKIENILLQQVFLYASKSLAYQHLKNWEDAEESIKQSMKFLKGWEHEHHQDKTKIRESNLEYLQTKIFALSVQGNLLNQQNNTQTVRDFDREGFNILQESKINPKLHDRLIKFLADANKDYLKNYYLDELNNLLANKKWEEADRTTWELMLLIAGREEERWLDIQALEKFSCPDLKKMDKLWVQNSDGHFGFSVQKEIWKSTGNRLGIKPEDRKYSDSQNYRRFASTVGWYNKKENNSGGWMYYDDFMAIVNKNWDDPSLRGGLPLLVGRFVGAGVSGGGGGGPWAVSWTYGVLRYYYSFLALRLVNCNM